MSRLIRALAIVTLLTPLTVHADEISYPQQIRPILARRCLPCHGPDAAARKGDLALHERQLALKVIAPGDPDASELMRRVLDADDRMPPPEHGPGLTPAEIALVRSWIEQGADYPPHWAFSPPSPPVQRDIDFWIAKGHREGGLQFNPPADRATLLRRLSLDLTGLPPTPAVVREFESDSRPDAYEQAVDRLLASPEYGERWAALWLDLARYADTKGYEKDGRRTMWPYRDWVIRALNRDLPFDRFTKEQLAGDLLPDSTDETRLATGFHRNTMTNDEGGTDDEEFRVAAVLDRVDTTLQVWMGLTGSCASCHDHKFDPLSHREYYSVFDVFNQTQDADRSNDSPLLPVTTDSTHARLRELDQSIAAMEELRKELKPRRQQRFQAWRALWTKSPPQALRPSETSHDTAVPQRFTLDSGAHDSTPLAVVDGDLEFVPGLHGDAVRLENGAAIDLEDAGDVERDQTFSFAYWERLDGDRVHVPIARMDATAAYRGWDVFIYERKAYVHFIHEWPTNCITVVTKDRLPLGEWHHLAITYDGKSQGSGVTVYLNGRRSSLEVTHDSLRDTIRTERSLFLGRRFGERDFHGELDDVRLYDRVLTPSEVERLVADGVSSAIQQERAGGFLRRYHRLHDSNNEDRTVVAQLAKAREEKKQLEAMIPKVPVMAELPVDQRRKSYVLSGGNFLSPTERVTADVPAIFHSWPTGAPRNRLGFSEWLTDPRNPLTARVAANRIWGALFGLGIVETQEDFGTQGELPTHRELLDHLALYLVERKWSQKALIRHIVLSRTYQQSSTATAEEYARDPRNRYLGRTTRLRLNAETIRDQALAVSGLLSPKRFGPPVYPPQPDGVWQMVYSSDRWMTSEGEDRYRRGLYTFWRRTSPYPSFTIFDAPSREVCTPRRIESATALQALVGLNDPVYHEAAQALAIAVLEGAPDEGNRIEAAFERVLCRTPRAEEKKTIRRLLASERAQFESDPERTQQLLTLPTSFSDRTELAAWVVVCGVLLNLDEFLTRG